LKEHVIQGRSTGREVWLRLGACLALSLGVHAGLGTVGWESPAVTAAERQLVAVSLVDAPVSAVPPPAIRPVPAPPARHGKPAVPAKSRPQVVPAQAEANAVEPLPDEPLCAVPEATVVEETGGTADEVAESPSTDGAFGVRESMASIRAGRERGNAGVANGLIKATPRYESNPLPHYPRLARQNRWEGTVRLRARVSASGTVEDVALERSSGHEVLDRSALDGVQRWRFIPATRGGLPVTCEVSIPVAFKLTE
jgi:protein TonB